MVVVLCEKPRYVFIHNPKAGGISVSTALRQGARAFKVPLVEHQLPFHADWQQVVASQGADWVAGACVFGVIRNPWARMVSWWNHIRETAAGRIEARRRGEPVKAGSSDDDDHRILEETGDLGFSDWILSQADVAHGYDIPFVRKPQLSWFMDSKGIVRADKLLILERFDENFLVPYFVPLGFSEKPSNRSVNRTPYSAYYSSECRDFIAEHFAPDIEWGNYTFGD
ncbi:MAG: sulfotransferase family 2 domain-containing protein [Rhodospirillales bacterium]